MVSGLKPVLRRVTGRSAGCKFDTTSHCKFGNRDETSWRNGAKAWVSAAVMQFGRVGVLGKASLSVYGVKPVG